MEETTLRVMKELNYIPTAEEFETQIEPNNTPAVLRGCVKDWKAFDSWNPKNDGLDHLQARVGSSVVEVMLSKSAPVFYGDIRSHERVPVPFSSFIEYCKGGNLKEGDSHAVGIESESARPDTDLFSSLVNAREQVYLAQVSIYNNEDEEKIQLGSLREDIETPLLLKSKTLSSINLWMNNAQSRSSTHYDPHHNLLCVVAGRKQVVLWPPSSAPLLYPMPLYGEASNHSSVPLESSDSSIYPRFSRAYEYSQKVILESGDALFIPEGWFHQVDSDELTIAVNFWWQSKMMSDMLEHMDSYYLRRIMRRLIDKEMNEMLPKTSGSGSAELRSYANEKSGNEITDDHSNITLQKRENKLKLETELHDLDPRSLQALRALVSLVHDGVKVTHERDQCASTSNSEVVSDKDCKKMICNICCLEDDPVANILWNLEPLTLQTVFLAMVHKFPRTLEGLILHMLSPVGAEVLTRKFDELDRQMTEEDRTTFYERFYSVFDDQFSAMDAILQGKESFACQAFKNVLGIYMGATFDGFNQRLQLSTDQTVQQLVMDSWLSRNKKDHDLCLYPRNICAIIRF